jgi:hypothetical protein
MSKCQ